MLPMRSPHLSPRRSDALDDTSCSADADIARREIEDIDEHERQLTDLLCAERPWLIRFFRRQSRFASHDEADDLAQEAITRFLRADHSTSLATPQAYLRRIAQNLLIDRAERGSTKIAERSVGLMEIHDLVAPDDQHRDLVGREELHHFNAILQQLKPRTLEIFLLSRVEGYTYKQIASKLGVTVWGVKWHMLRAIEHVDRNRGTR
ncbi:putative sigma-70 factor, ECF subfamily protein [Novosphingobium sp. KN65.2]|nr:putative sigma-70 factor, ECF subfamily protein [Novosphingobium sp. KN65.2]